MIRALSRKIIRNPHSSMGEHMITITFGLTGAHTVTTDSLNTAVMIADALKAKGWLRILVTDPDGNFVPWRTLPVQSRT
jgi:hypothetical protein